MPYAKLAQGLKRVRLNLNLDPKTVKKLKEISQDIGIPVSRVIDRVFLDDSDMSSSSKIPGVDIDAVIAKLKAKKR